MLKQVIISAVVAVIFGGLAGGIVARQYAASMADTKSDKAEQAGDNILTVDKLVAKEIEVGEKIVLSKGEEVCAITPSTIKTSHIIASKTLEAINIIAMNQIRGKNILSASFLASPDFAELNMNNCRIYGEFTAGTEIGGLILLRNKDGVYIGSQGGPKAGNEIYIGHNNQGGASIFTHDISKGNGGRLFYLPIDIEKLAAQQKAAQQNPAAKTPPISGPEIDQ